MIQLGQAVGNYRVVDLLGEGGMGAVYLAEHPVIGRKAALKVIHPQHARNPEVVGRFVDEATAINRVGHQHIVEVTDFGRTPGGDFYFIMEYLEGMSLSEAIARGAPFAPERARKIAGQIADALAASHASGVIHRDLKPENIFLVERDGDPDFVKVLDFGLAKLLHEAAPARHQTLRGTVMGTPDYMSPEQCEGRAALDARADVYSLGVVLFEMLTGHLPFEGSDPAQVLLKQLTAPPPAARTLVPALPEELDRILERALAKRVEDRFASMELLRAALVAPPPERELGLIERPADEGPDRVPRNAGPRNFVLVALGLLLGAGSAAGLTRRHLLRLTAAPQASAAVAAPLPAPAVEPRASTALETDTTPPAARAAVEEEDDDPPAPPVRRHVAAHRARTARPALPPDEDDVLAPSFVH